MVQILSHTPAWVFALFLIALSAIYGLLSGYFVARALHLVKTARIA